MNAYIPVLIWLISGVIAYYIARIRNVKPTFLWRLTVVVLGPLSIPLVLFAKTEKK